jgi:phospholipid/cholesterol/gamma-HCH transport system substrate-binding protein
MDEKRLRFHVGAFVVIAILILMILIVLNGEFTGSQYDIVVKPATAPGVTEGTPVRKNGILIGRVRNVEIEDDHVVLILGISEGKAIYSNEIASIGAESFLGDAGIEIMPLPRDQRGQRMAGGQAMTRVSVKRNPMEIVDVALDMEAQIIETLKTVQVAGNAVNDAGAGIEQLASTVNMALNDEGSDLKILLGDLRTVSGKASSSLDNFNRIFENMNDIVGDAQLKTRINDAFKALPAVFREIRVTVADTRETIKSFSGVSSRVNDNLDNLSAFTKSLKNEGPEILEQVNASVRNIDQLLAQVKSFTGSLGKLEKAFTNPEGTVGKLFNESDISAQVKALSVRLEPMVRDLRTFADEVARDPGVIGVRGALDRRPTKTGYKGSAEKNGLFR